MTVFDHVESAVRQLVAVEEIRTLMAKYCRGFDDQDQVRFASIWTVTATLQLAGRGNASGPAEILALTGEPWTVILKSRHHITNPIIEVHADSATAKTDVLLYGQTHQGQVALASGRYDFAFESEPDAWRVSQLTFAGADAISPAFASLKELVESERSSIGTQQQAGA